MTLSALRARHIRRSVTLPPAAARAAASAPARGRVPLTRRLLVAADLAGPAAAFAAVAAAAGVSGRTTLVFALVLPAWVGAAQVGGLYGRDRRVDHSTADELPALVAVVTVGTWAFVLIASAGGALGWSPDRLTAFWAAAVALVVAGRVVARALARRNRSTAEDAIVVGAADAARLVARKLDRHPEYGIRLVRVVEDGAEELPGLVRELQVGRVIVADPHPGLLEPVHRLRADGVRVDVVPTLHEAVDPGAEVHSIEGLPLIALLPSRRSPAARACKRAVDLVLASAALLLAAPLLALVAWRVKRDSPGPVFFRQTRLGLEMRPFTALKFRTMWTDVDDASHRDYIRSTMSTQAAAEGNGLYKLERRDDVTPFGRFLRRTSIDELPQLWNVVRGEMSLVGPRPCIPYETENFAPHHFDRFLVPAGLTGLWQVAARARASFGEQLEMDVAYARGWSLGLDFRLLCRTPLAVLRQAATA